MSKENKSIPAPVGGGVKEVLDKSVVNLEPTTPQGPAMKSYDFPIEITTSKSATEGVPGAVPTPESRRRSEDDPNYHQAYPRDIRHGEHIFPNVKGHNAEEYENEVEAHASPDDISPEVR